MQNNIVLCGFMGCGKTTVGKDLAENLGYTFIDTDEFIEKRENMSVSDIFAQKGEPYFRSVETEVTKELAERQGLVIATGGGMMLNSQNAESLNKIGVSFWIKVSVETILQRLKGDTTRPLLQREDKDAAIRELLQKREPFYLKHSNFCIDGEGEPKEVVERILKALEKGRL